MFKFLAKMAGASSGAPALTVGGVRMARAQEPLHLLLAGSTGTGKTTAVGELLDGTTTRGDRAVIVDPNGAYLARYHEAGDVILNPFDRRGAGWSPFAEVRKPYDFDKVARSIVRDVHGPDAAWHFYAQVLIAEVMRALIRDGQGTTAALLEALTVRGADRLHKLVAGSAAAGLFDKDASRALASTRFVPSDCRSCHLKPQCTPAPERKITRWEHEEVLERMQNRLNYLPVASQIRRATAVHVFGTLKTWMGPAHFLTKRLRNVRTDVSLQVLAYNMKRAM